MIRAIVGFGFAALIGIFLILWTVYFDRRVCDRLRHQPARVGARRRAAGGDWCGGSRPHHSRDPLLPGSFATARDHAGR